MTVASEVSRFSYQGNGTTGPWSCGAHFIADSHLKVIKTNIETAVEQVLTLNSDYTVEGAGESAGGTVTTTAVVPVGYSLVIINEPDMQQLTEYSRRDPFPADSHEAALDKLTLLVQRLRDLVNRSFRLSDGDTSSSSLVLPPPIPNRSVKWNDDGTALVHTSTDPDSYVIAAAASASAAETARAGAVAAKNEAETVLSGAVAAKDTAVEAAEEAVAAAGSIHPEDFATAAQGEKADSALQSDDIGVSVMPNVAPGTAGNILVDNGTSWVSEEAPSGGGFQLFTSSGTFTIPSANLKVSVVGGGGKGGDATGADSGGGGGGGGGVAIKYLSGLTVGSTVTVTVGGVSGTSSFGSHCSATGGAAAPTVSSADTGGAGGVGGTGTNGDFNFTGSTGSAGTYNSGSDYSRGGAGGLCGGTQPVGMFGGAGGVATENDVATNGNPATGYGNGGGGANAPATTDYTGGAGTPGLVLIEW